MVGQDIVIMLLDIMPPLSLIRIDIILRQYIGISALTGDDAEYLYEKKRKTRLTEYKQNPTWNQYTKTKWWQFKNYTPVLGRNFTSVILLGSFSIASQMTGLFSIMVLHRLDGRGCCLKYSAHILGRYV